MKYVDSGSGRMPLVTLLAVLSVSLIINLPGLAVSPMLGKIHHLFHTSILESQLLTSLPNLFMIPVVIIAGRIATPQRQTAVLITGLVIFLIAGALCFFARNIGTLILLSCFIGIGCGLVVPIAAGLISEWFSGHSRQVDLGYKSTVANAMVITANLYVGWIAITSWRAAFAVYLLPLIPLCLVPFMTQRYVAAHRITSTAAPQPTADDTASDTMPLHFSGRKSTVSLMRLILLYAFLTYATTSISYYAPFLMDHFGMNTSQVGIVTAMYYLLCAICGIFVGKLKRILGPSTILISLSLVALGLISIGLTRSYGIYLVASFITGFGYGIIQPIIYDKTTYVAPTRKLGTLYFGYVLSANYFGITIVPYIDTFFRNIFGATAPGFEFTLSGLVVLVLLLWARLERNDYTFTVNPDNPAPTAAQIAA